MRRVETRETEGVVEGKRKTAGGNESEKERRERREESEAEGKDKHRFGGNRQPEHERITGSGTT